EIGFDQLSGVARSSRTGTKRNVKAGPTTRLPEKPKGIVPAIQERRMPFFRSIVVMVPVVTLRRMSMAELITTPLSRLEAQADQHAAVNTRRKEPRARPSRVSRQSAPAGTRASQKQAREMRSNRLPAPLCSRQQPRRPICGAQAAYRLQSRQIRKAK